MTETRLVLVRHAQHDHGGRFLQHACTGLTPEGVRQANALAKRLAAEYRVDAVLSSRAARAVLTAGIVATALRLSPRPPTCDLCEMHPGQAEGLTYAEMKERFGPTYAQVPGAEYFPDWLPRATKALDGLAGQHHGKTIVAVTHFAVMKASFVAFGRMPRPEADLIETDNTAITVWTRNDQTAPAWRLERHNDTAHLT